MKIRYDILLRTMLSAAVALSLVSCLSDFDEYNHNPNETTDEELRRDNYLTGSYLEALMDQVIPAEEHQYQFIESLVGQPYARYTAPTPNGWVQSFPRFNPPQPWVKALFNDPLTNVYPNWRGIRKSTEDAVILALADVLRVSVMHRLTDQFGPIPYTQIAENRKGQLTVGYDTQEQAYTAMFGELDAALAVLEANRDLPTEALADYDRVYGGDIARWIKYTNSLKLRMALRLSYVDPTTAQTRAAEAIAGGCILSNADNAALHPAVNRTAMIYNDWQDHVLAAEIVAYTDGYRDPRQQFMFTSVTVGTGETATQGYAGLRVGPVPGNSQTAKDKCSFPLLTEQSPLMWFCAAEVAFLRAEYALRWGTASEAGEFYRQGVQLSFEQWGAGKADEYLADATCKPAAFTDPMGTGYNFMAPSSITPVWNDEDTPETALERIITQKWIALFPLGNEAWAEHRRTGYPRFSPIPDDCNLSGGTVDSSLGARRIPYPAEEYSENRANVEEAVRTQLGGADNAGTRLWWDCKPLN